MADISDEARKAADKAKAKENELNGRAEQKADDIQNDMDRDQGGMQQDVDDMTDDW